jgi:type I restriction enzyme, R subunit
MILEMKFNEQKLEKAIIQLFKQVNYNYVKGEHLNREISDVLIKSDLKEFLFERYKSEEITEYEVESIIRSLEILPSSALYDSNKKIMNMISEGFTIKREDSTKKDLFIQLLDYENIDNNLFKIVNQMEIKEYHERIPDAIVYVNGLPLVVFEFKSAIREDATIYDAYIQLTVRYRRDIPELFKYNALCVISDGVNNKAGSFFAPYEFFYSWRKIEGNENLEKDGIKKLNLILK